ncbi:hypothetical protein [Mesorhizobium australafricanum]|uniref:Secreted protein n=1 Tax=Mesorhizobium australafricanum TaxID=3072311 RepID=A0ABU4X4T8_9HYPH|nr:hypothetical protein [Mesorhizobium sp. VK3E]MDX8443308.1 hypothetical protein [Mesorhizobium sp. VK3E]
MFSMPRLVGLRIALGQFRSAWRGGKLRRRRAALGWVIFSALSSTVAHASEHDICQIGDPVNAKLGLAQIKPSKGTDLREAEAPCPDANNRCKPEIHLKKNELVLTTGRVNGPYVCVYVAGSYLDQGGYVKQTDIAPRPPLPLKAWKGKWREPFGSWIRLSVEGAALKAEGEAFYPSAHPSKKDFPGGPHMGDMPPGPSTPRNNVAVFANPDDHDPEGCRVIVALDKATLIVSDNGNCGGMNVRFSGNYYK